SRPCIAKKAASSCPQWGQKTAQISGGCDSLCSLCPEIGHGVYSRRQFLVNAAIASSLSCARILFRLYSMPKDSHTRQGNCHEITSDRGFFVSFDDQPSQYAGLL